MQQRQLGAQGPMTSAIGLGCMGMSEFYGASDDDSSLRTLARALEIGVMHFDTADTYGLGHNESLLGRFIAAAGPAARERMQVATRCCSSQFMHAICSLPCAKPLRTCSKSFE